MAVSFDIGRVYDVLEAIGDGCKKGVEVAKKIDLVSPVYPMINALKELGLIEVNKVGRDLELSLTESGKEVYKAVKLMKKLDREWKKIVKSKEEQKQMKQS